LHVSTKCRQIFSNILIWPNSSKSVYYGEFFGSFGRILTTAYIRNG